MLAVLAADRRRVVENRTAIGYSTLWLALGQPVDGTIVTIDPDRDRTGRARELWRRAGVPDLTDHRRQRPGPRRVRRRHATLAGPFDPRVHRRAQARVPGLLRRTPTRLAPGAYVIADNVLWSGRASGSRPARDGDGTAELRELCRRLSTDPDFETTILPIGDGLLVAALRP